MALISCTVKLSYTLVAFTYCCFAAGAISGGQKALQSSLATKALEQPAFDFDFTATQFTGLDFLRV